MMRSAVRTVDSRCAITIVVRFWPRSLRAACTSRSVRESSALVASSSSTRGGSFSRHRAMATLCFSPPESFSPRSPTLVCHWSGSERMKVRICAFSQLFSISSMVASMRPYRTLCRMVSLNRHVSCGTTPMARRIDFCVKVATSFPPISTDPLRGS
mmetsp:Transcript_12916/g.21926  ORF Transcript_12916/g.21926 Transcript_12916/m.21926 type:complete len:156 (+) Transcript_12916:245-712(+)